MRLRIKQDQRGISNVIVVMLSLVILVIISANVILWSYQMNQLDWERTQENIAILDITPIRENWSCNPSGYALGESTSWLSGDISDLTADDGVYMSFRSYYSGTDASDFVDNNTSDVDSSADKGTHGNFPAQQYGPDSIYDTLTEKNTGGSYTELWSDTFKPTAAATWETKSLDSYGVPANSVAIIHIYQNEAANVKRDAGVRAVGSSLNRYIPMHEAEGGGLVIVSMMVQVDANKNIEIYAETIATNTISFRVIGYFTGVTYTEKFEHWNPNYDSTWTDKDLYTDYGVPKGSVAEIFVANANPSAERYVGARADSSSLDRRILIHESEGGGQDGFTLCVKTNADNGKIECYNTGTTGHFYLLGYFDSTMDYVERMDSLAAATADVWENETLSTPPNAIVEVSVENDAGGNERYGGVRANPSSLDRRVLIHEAEAGGLTGGRWSVQSDASSTIEIYEDRTQDIKFALVGYWIMENCELDLEVQWIMADYQQTYEYLCIKTGTLGAESLSVDVWNGSAWINILTDLTANSWNNVSVSSYLDSSTFTIRFKGATETGDTTQDSWDIDVTLLHIWSDEYTSEVELTGLSNMEDWSQLTWTVDSAWTVSSVSVTLQLYNYTLGGYPASGNGYITYTSNNTPNTDENKSQTINVNPTHFRNATGYWKIKVKGVKATDTPFDFKSDWIEFKVMKVSGTLFTFKNEGSLTSHLVSLWIINSTVHQRYDISVFVNSGETLPYLRVDICLPSGEYTVKVVTERGNIAVYSGS